MSTTERFDAPPAAVFAALTEPEQLAAWNHAFDRAERLDAGPLQVGSRLRLTSRVDGRPADVDVEVVALDPPRELQLEAASDDVRSLTTLTVREVDGGSEATATSGAVVDDPAEDPTDERTVEPEANPAFAEVGPALLDGLRAAIADEPVEPH